MSKALIIAEKPSVMNDLARVLGKNASIGKFESKKEFFENSSYLISSAVGHLVEQKLPTTPDGKNLPWKFDCLPVIPDEFELQPIDGNKQRLNLLVRLMKRKDVTEVINACDAGREGELIFRYIMKLAGIDKPTRRLWMQSMTDGAINDAFSNLRSDDDMQPLASAAVCRSESDWLIGINSTRAMTAYNSRWGGFNKTPVGRVQTPTLALLSEREVEISNFVSEDYFEIHGDFEVKAGIYPGRWFDETFKKSEDKPHGRAERIWDKAFADEVVARCEGKAGTVEEKKKPSKQTPPMLYDLTSLQREANGRFGFSARRTLQLAQSLYERHKALTYPRTDSRYLPDDYVGTAVGTMKKIAAESGGIVTNLPKFADQVVQNDWVKGGNKRIFNGAKVSDHFAIIPTGQFPGKLDEAEQKLYDMVTRRFVATFFPHAEFEITTRITRIGEDAFKTDGKILVVPGWLGVYGKTAASASNDDEEESKDGKNIVPVEDGESANVDKIERLDKVTKPPARYNESTLLSAMETAGKRVDDEELREAMSERGLGTPATRASIIEGLINDKYVSREGRDLFVSNRGLRLIEQIKDMKINILASPEMTGEWEYKLKQMEAGELTRPAFMNEIRQLTQDVVGTAKTAAAESLNREYPTFPVACPVCGVPELGQDEGRYKCTEGDCKFALPKVLATRPMSEDEVKELLTKKFVGPLTGFISRFKKPFDAAVELQEDKKAGLKPAFVFEKTPEEEAEVDAITDENILTDCPVCEGGKIYTTPHSYVCNERVLGDGCKGRLSREMCKVEIPPEQAKKFFDDGATDLFENFISKKGRPFKAKLTCNPKGRRILNWEFPPREPKKKAAAKKTTAKKKSTKKAATKKSAKS
ncbi:MAG: DNA topoisomerase III [Verrucomicrobiota bacterium]